MSISKHILTSNSVTTKLRGVRVSARGDPALFGFQVTMSVSIIPRLNRPDTYAASTANQATGRAHGGKRRTVALRRSAQMVDPEHHWLGGDSGGDTDPRGLRNNVLDGRIVLPDQHDLGGLAVGIALRIS